MIEQGLDSRNGIRYPSFPYPSGTSTWDLRGCGLLGFVGPERLLAQQDLSIWRSKDHRDAGLRLFEVTLGQSPDISEYVVSLHPDESAMDVALSPNGSTLAMVVRNDGPDYLPPPLNVIAKWIPRVRGNPRSRATLYVMDRFGHKRRTLGELPIQTEELNFATGCYYNLKWSPDGKHIAFVCNKALWVTSSKP